MTKKTPPLQKFSSGDLALLEMAVTGMPLSKSQLEPAKRDTMLELGLIEIRKRPKGRGDEILLTEVGWRHLNENQVLDFGKRPNPSAKVLQNLLPCVHRFLSRHDSSFSGLFLSQSEDTSGKSLMSHQESIPGLIRAGYLELTSGRFDIDVRLKHLREKLRDADAETVSLCLMGMILAGRAQAAHIADALVIDDDDRAAALNLGGHSKQLIRILQ